MTTDTARWVWPGLVDTTGPGPRLMGSRCTSCGTIFYPPVADCPDELLQGATEPLPLSGRGTIAAHSVVQRGLPGFPSPYVLASIELEEGPACIAQLDDVDSATVEPGLAVEHVVGVIRTDPDGVDVHGPKFRVVERGGSR